MKAISLWQPWASLIACGAKPFETRHWAPPRDLIGQRIAIHAAKKVDKFGRALAEDVCFGKHSPGGFELAEKIDATIAGIPNALLGAFGMARLPVGCVVATAILDAAFQLGDEAERTEFPAATTTRQMISRPMPEGFIVRYDEFGDYEPNRWAWLLSDVIAIRPTEGTVGRQGFFDVDNPVRTGA